MLNTKQKILKRFFDMALSIFGICVTLWIMFLAWIVASIETKSNGLFIQERIGMNGTIFSVFKIKTMKPSKEINTSVTTSSDSRITRSGAFFRKMKIDELPQLFNVLFGSMSFVGPRPDVSGFADKLNAEDRLVLGIRPGITGPASIKYKDEEDILAKQKYPEVYNREVIWPDKVKINIDYIQNWSFKKDIMYIVKTVLG